MIRPRRAWPLYERFLRNVAGLGRVDEHGARHARYDVEHRRVDVLVVGGGDARAAQRRARQRGRGRAGRARRRGPAPRRATSRSRSSRPARALGVYEGGLVPVEAGDVLFRFRARADRRRDRRGRAAARLPRQRPRRRHAPRRRAAPRRDFGAQARRARGRASPPTTAARGRASSRGAGVEVVRDRRPARARAGAVAAHGRRGRLDGGRVDGEAIECDLLVAAGRPPARVLAARPGRRAGRVRRRARHLRPDRPAGGRRGRRLASTGERLGASPTARSRGEGEVLRLRLRGRDVQGHEARDRRGLRLDRAREALHDGDDGPVPGAALPPRARSGSTRARRAPTRRRSARRRRGRRGRRSRSALLAGRGARAREAHVDPPPPPGGGRRRSCGRAPGGGRTPTAMLPPRRGPCTSASA